MISRQLATRALLAAMLLTALLLLASCSEEVAPAPPALRAVRTTVVEVSESEYTSSFAGVAKQGTESWLSFRVAGTLIERVATVGRPVKKNQVIARLDPVDYETAVEQAKASLAQAKAAARQARADYTRARALYENSNASLAELDAARAASESGQAQVAAAEQELEARRLQLDYTSLRAPASGVVAEFGAEVNENVNSGQKIILLTAGTHPEVEIVVPEALVSQLSVGQQATVVFDALPTSSFQATVSEIGIVATGSSAYSVTVRLAAPAALVRSGMAANVTLSFFDPARSEAIFLAPIAVGQDQDGRFVFVVEKTSDGVGKVRRTPVETGRISPLGLEIESGLQPGQTVVTAGVRRLSDGMQVKLPGDPENER